MTSRRTLLSYAGMLSIGAALPSYARADDDELDEALEMLAPYAPSYRGGLSNHGPMTAEALVSLGHHDAVIGWVESYRRRLEARPSAVKRIEESAWREALGDTSRLRDWEDWFGDALKEALWSDLVALWVPRLIPGMAAAGMHGVIRAGHAVASLAIKETPARLDELARALGYWAAEYMTLPGELSEGGVLSPSSALKSVAFLPGERRVSRGLITSQLAELRGFEPFEQVIDLVDPKAGTPDFMADLSATFAGVFVNTRSSSFDFLHAFTGAAAVTELLPYVEAEQQPRVRSFAWQASAGIFARYGRGDLGADVESATNEVSPEQLARTAVASGDEHTIKLAAACAREWSRNPDPRLRAAVAKRNG